MSRQNVELLEAMLPGPDTDVANLFRDESLFASTAEAVEGPPLPLSCKRE